MKVLWRGLEHMRRDDENMIVQFIEIGHKIGIEGVSKPRPKIFFSDMMWVLVLKS